MARQWAARDGRQGSRWCSPRAAIDKLEAVAAQCRAHGAQVLVRHCDVALQARLPRLVRAATDAFGRIDILVNNAGMSAHALFEVR